MTFLSLVVGIATIIAGVIGIGNILLISVKERTKELGVRRALGATPAEVRMQIISESVFLTVIAGIFGIVLGICFGRDQWRYSQPEDFPYTNSTVPISFVLGALVIMVTFGTLIGLISPNVVSIKPIDALRKNKTTTHIANKIVRYLLISLLVFGLLFAAAYFIKSNSKMSISFETQSPLITNIEQQYNGKVIPEDEVEVKPQVQGILQGLCGRR